MGFYNAEEKKYDLYSKSEEKKGKHLMTSQELSDYYKNWFDKYPFVSIEDPFDQDDWDAYRDFTAGYGEKMQVVGDDLLVTNPKRIGKALEACKICQDNGWVLMVSHRSGETEDVFIADLSVGLCAGQIKTGAPCRSERLAKYNQLMRIEEELGIVLCTQ